MPAHLAPQYLPSNDEGDNSTNRDKKSEVPANAGGEGRRQNGDFPRFETSFRRARSRCWWHENNRVSSTRMIAP
jgi:hypothetical protein